MLKNITTHLVDSLESNGFIINESKQLIDFKEKKKKYYIKYTQNYTDQLNPYLNKYQFLIEEMNEADLPNKRTDEIIYSDNKPKYYYKISDCDVLYNRFILSNPVKISVQLFEQLLLSYNNYLYNTLILREKDNLFFVIESDYLEYFIICIYPKLCAWILKHISPQELDLDSI